MKALNWVWTLMAVVSLVAVARGQVRAGVQSEPGTFSLVTGRDLEATLTGLARFQFGDDQAWASPGFDDSGWGTIKLGQSWSTQGFKDRSGLAWYRFRVVVPAGDTPLGLRLFHVGTCYELFVDGKLALAQGKMPPHARMYVTKPVVVALPDGDKTAARTIWVAVRVWHDPEWSNYWAGGIVGSVAVGDRARLTQELEAGYYRAQSWETSVSLDEGALQGLAAAVSLALFLFRRKEREYLWFAVMQAGQAYYNLSVFFFQASAAPYDVNWKEQAEVFAVSLMLVGFLMMMRYLLKTPSSVVDWAMLACCGLFFVGATGSNLSLIPVPAENVGELLFTVPIFFWVTVMLLRRARVGAGDARLLLIPTLVFVVSRLYLQAHFTLATFGHPFASRWTEATLWPFSITYEDLGQIFFLLAMLAVLIYRFARTSREQDRSAAEFEAARTVQQVLIPEMLPVVAGVTIQTAYHPAQEVGGDFFQIIPLAGDATLIVVGDVSGKGMAAAMTVSLIVGTLRTLAEFTDSPGEILAGLNRRLYGRGAGFTTCVALRIAADGSARIANAGHLAPYRNGVEMETDAALPLGLDTGAVFAEGTFLLDAGDRLTLMTDGVVEAMDGEGTLFGFGRTEAMSGDSAEKIAGAAREFGQNDDITVLTVDLAGRRGQQAKGIPQGLKPPALSLG